MIGAENAPDGASPRAKTIARSDALRVAVASLVSAGSGYFVLAFAARVLLPVENNTVFVTFWSTLFACFGVLSGLSIETTRAVTVATSAPVGERDDGHPRVLTVGVTVGVLAGLTVAATSPLWATRLFAADAFWLAGLASLGVAGVGGHSEGRQTGQPEGIGGEQPSRPEWRGRGDRQPGEDTDRDTDGEHSRMPVVPLADRRRSRDRDRARGLDGEAAED